MMKTMMLLPTSRTSIARTEFLCRPELLRGAVLVDRADPVGPEGRVAIAVRVDVAVVADVALVDLVEHLRAAAEIANVS
jgi:hypothetical protein